MCSFPKFWLEISLSSLLIPSDSFWFSRIISLLIFIIDLNEALEAWTLWNSVVHCDYWWCMPGIAVKALSSQIKPLLVANLFPGDWIPKLQIFRNSPFKCFLFLILFNCLIIIFSFFLFNSVPPLFSVYC